MRTETTPTMSEGRAPQMTRLRMSLPSSSVPSRWAALGGCMRARRLISSAPYGARKGASMAMRTTRTTITRPATAAQLPLKNFSRLGRRRRVPGATVAIADTVPPSAVLDARVEQAVAQVDKQVHEDDQDGEEGDRPLDLRVVAGHHG